MATVPTPASPSQVASSPKPLAVVENDCFVTLTERLGWTTRAHATTVSRWTSSPATLSPLSRICFIAAPPRLDVEAAAEDRVKRMLGFVLVATVRGPRGPRTRLCAHTRLQAEFGDHVRQPPPAFH